MGIFDFFRKKPAPPPELPEDRGPSAHYALAHYALRQHALADPLCYLAVLASPKARDFLNDVLSDVCEHLSCTATFTASDLQVHPICIGEHPCAIVEFPPPEDITEAFFTALLVFVNLDDGLPEEGSKVAARYITLEKGVSDNNRPRTVLCEWTDTSHLNFGDGPPPTLYAFEQALTEMVDERRSE